MAWCSRPECGGLTVEGTAHRDRKLAESPTSPTESQLTVTSTSSVQAS
jgi:hypothetical protein